MDASHRVEKLRALMREEGLDAYVVRRVSDLAWLTGFERVFDDELAHTAVLTQDACIIHTDSRYANTMRERVAACGGAGSGGEAAHGEADGTYGGVRGNAGRAAPDAASGWTIDDTVFSGATHPAPAAFTARVLSELGMPDACVAVDADMPVSLFLAFEQALPDAQLVVCKGDILSLRAVKDAAEMELMRAAQACAEAGFARMLEQLHAGMTQREASLALEFAIREAGADALSFPNIVASGPDGANPHAQPGERVLHRGDLVVFDFGARRCGYCSDTTRTVAIGSPGFEQQRAWDALIEANAQVRRALRPGVTGREMHELAEAVLADAGFAGKMGHALGHGVGLDIHERPFLSSREDKPLTAGNVVTVEPGIYIAGSFGMRLEDFGAVVDGGFENFCSLPHELAVVE